MNPKIINKNIRRGEILHAAMRVVAQKGIKNVKIDDVAVAAGIGKGTIYEYFSSKDELFGASIREFMQKTEEVQAKKMFKAVTPPEKLKAIIDAWVEACEGEESEFMELLIDFWAEGIRGNSSEVNKIFDIKAIYSDYRTILSAIINDGINSGIFKKVDAMAAAGVFLASVDGLMIQWLMDKMNFSLRVNADILYNIFMTGISEK